MKTYFLSFLILSCCTTFTFAQNLVLNPDFESYFDCPVMEGNFYLDDWETAGGSCDFYHVCSTSPGTFFVGVPTNFAGYQWPNSGEGYAGTVAWGFEPDFPDQGSIREYIAATLSEPLTVGTTYYVSAMVSLSNISSEACNNLGFKFIHEDLLGGPFFDNPVMDNTAHIYTDQIISDTADWVMINGSFVADDNYPYMAIGNFFDDVNTDTSYMGEITELGNQVAYFAYYYYDDICVSTEPGFCFPIPVPTSNISEMDQITLTPNPVRQTISFDNIEGVDRILITDLMGRSLMDLPAREEVDVEGLGSGVYVVRFLDVSGDLVGVLRFLKV